ncbi:MAG TPA: adenylate/guanylate cyclase domain-containing protein [Gaiellaceae bacterium]|nr:adenylate/guanylate cyclase domain-containing protein [Gaiellaceae bacterium]
MTTLPGGTVTFVFTDIEGSTRLLQELGDEAYGRVAGDHRRLVRQTFGEHGGTEIDTQGDAFFFSFPRARDAVAAAVDAQRALRDHEWPDGSEVRVRMGLHTGEPHMGEEGYLGLDVVRAARISAAGHGGQILISETTRALLGNQLPEGVAVHDLGQQDLKDVQHEHIYELTIDGRAASPKPLKTQSPQTQRSRQEDMASRFEDRITAYVEQQLESAFDPESGAPKAPTKLAFGGAAIGFGVLLMMAIVVVAIVLLVKVVFF